MYAELLKMHVLIVGLWRICGVTYKRWRGWF